VSANRSLGTHMKATGEVMAIGRSFEESLLKAVRSLEISMYHLENEEARAMKQSELQAGIENATDERLFIVAEALRRGVSIQTIHDWSKIDLFFLHKLNKIIELENKLKKEPFSAELAVQAK